MQCPDCAASLTMLAMLAPCAPPWLSCCTAAPPFVAACKITPCQISNVPTLHKSKQRLNRSVRWPSGTVLTLQVSYRYGYHIAESLTMLAMFPPSVALPWLTCCTTDSSPATACEESEERVILHAS